MQSHLEIERKFVLKAFPQDILDKREFKEQSIQQFYYFINGIWERFRSIAEGSNVSYIHTIKKKLRKGVYDEKEREITLDEYSKAYETYKSNKRKLIEKVRYVIRYKGLKFEIDVYKKIHLIILEIELPDMKHPIIFPPGLEKYIIGEVTGVKGFSNLSMAEEF